MLVFSSLGVAVCLDKIEEWPSLSAEDGSEFVWVGLWHCSCYESTALVPLSFLEV